MILPFETKGTLQGTYLCGEGETSLSYTGVTDAERIAYVNTLCENGYAKTAENRIGNNLFETYCRGDEGLRLSYYPAITVFKLTTLTGDNLQPILPPPADGIKLCTPSVAQLGRYGDPQYAPGMAMVFRLSDGRFFIIDGGGANDQDEQVLLNYLLDHSPNRTKPVIAGWFFTHGHGDHMGLPCRFAERYGSQVTLQAVYANFPDCDTMKMVYEENIFITTSVLNWRSLQKQYYPDAVSYKFHAGDRFRIADAEIEVLFTHEDFFPEEIYYGNDTSSVFRMTFGDKTVLITGDSDVRSNRMLAQIYGTELKCDILQIPHHGFNGPILELYRCTDPDICFWPVEEGRFANDSRCLGTAKGYEFNAWLRADAGDDGQRAREHYHASLTKVIPLT